MGKLISPSAWTLTRAQLEAELGAKVRALPERRYVVLYADPPWRFEVYSRDTGLDRDAANHYPVMTLDDIKALDVASIAASDSVLFLWGTSPMIEHAHEVMRAWGFAYKSQFIWVKDRVGLGFWARGKHEILLVGTRGKVPAPAPGTQFPSVIEAKAREHSRKPDEAYEIIERYFPTAPKVELFARPGMLRPTWDYWGPEAPPFGMSEDENLETIEAREIRGEASLAQAAQDEARASRSGIAVPPKPTDAEPNLPKIEPPRTSYRGVWSV
jgi:N6-adenosine-specific RNA methylase IME4